MKQTWHPVCDELNRFVMNLAKSGNFSYDGGNLPSRICFSGVVISVQVIEFEPKFAFRG